MLTQVAATISLVTSKRPGPHQHTSPRKRPARDALDFDRRRVNLYYCTRISTLVLITRNDEQCWTLTPNILPLTSSAATPSWITTRVHTAAESPTHSPSPAISGTHTFAHDHQDGAYDVFDDEQYAASDVSA